MSEGVNKIRCLYFYLYGARAKIIGSKIEKPETQQTNENDKELFLLRRIAQKTIKDKDEHYDGDQYSVFAVIAQPTL